MSTDEKVSPRPWKAIPPSGKQTQWTIWEGFDDPGRRKWVCKMYMGESPHEEEEYAAHIVLCVNSHDRLVEALEAALLHLAHPFECSTVRPTEEWSEHGSVSFENCSCHIALCRAALAAAKGEA